MACNVSKTITINYPLPLGLSLTAHNFAVGMREFKNGLLVQLSMVLSQLYNVYGFILRFTEHIEP